MRIAVLGTGSRGNAIALHAAGATLLVDAGFGPRTVTRRAAVAGVPLVPLAGIVVTHEHGDHARAAARVARQFGCPVAASPGTLAAIGPADGVPTHALEPHRATTLGPFVVQVARTSHDAREPLAVAVTPPDGTTVGVAYDLGRPTSAVRYLLRGCAALVLEANHDEVMLRTGPYPATVRHRIAGSTGHLSNRAAADLAADVCTERLRAVILVHLSEQCNRPDLAVAEVRRALAARGFQGSVYVAHQVEPLAAVPVVGPPQLPLSL